MKKYLIILASLLLCSCESEERQLENPVKEYELVAIQFLPVVADQTEKVNVEYSGGHLRNATATSVFRSATIEQEVDDESAFTFNQALPKEIASRKDLFVKVPNIMGEPFADKILFSNTPQFNKRVFKYEARNEEIPPFCEYSVTCQISGYKQTNNFTVLFKEIHSGEIIEIKGKWNGTKYVKMENKVVFKPIK